MVHLLVKLLDQLHHNFIQVHLFNKCCHGNNHSDNLFLQKTADSSLIITQLRRLVRLCFYSLLLFVLTQEPLNTILVSEHIQSSNHLLTLEAMLQVKQFLKYAKVQFPDFRFALTQILAWHTKQTAVITFALITIRHWIYLKLFLWFTWCCHGYSKVTSFCHLMGSIQIQPLMWLELFVNYVTFSLVVWSRADIICSFKENDMNWEWKTSINFSCTPRLYTETRQNIKCIVYRIIKDTKDLEMFTAYKALLYGTGQCTDNVVNVQGYN